MSQFCLSIALLILLVSMVSCTPWDIHESHDKGYIGHEITFHKPHIRIARLHLKVHHAATKDSACKMKILHHQGNKREHTASQPAFCRKRFQTGICKARMLRYYYNTNSGRCEVFTYGGCYGNRNKFLTAEECMKNCGGHAGTQGEHGYVTPPNV